MLKAREVQVHTREHLQEKERRHNSRVPLSARRPRRPDLTVPFTAERPEDEPDDDQETHDDDREVESRIIAEPALVVLNGLRIELRMGRRRDGLQHVSPAANDSPRVEP
jgi:hypothetical protein